MGPDFDASMADEVRAMFSQQIVALAILGHSHNQQDQPEKPGQDLPVVAQPSTPLEVGPCQLPCCIQPCLSS